MAFVLEVAGNLFVYNLAHAKYILFVIVNYGFDDVCAAVCEFQSVYICVSL